MTIDLRPALANALAIPPENLFARPEDLFEKQVPAIFLAAAFTDFKFPCTNLANPNLNWDRLAKNDLGREVMAGCYAMSPPMIANQLRNVLLDVHFPYDSDWDFQSVLRFAQMAQKEVVNNDKNPRFHNLLKEAIHSNRLVVGPKFTQLFDAVTHEVLHPRDTESQDAAILILESLIKKDPLAPEIRNLFGDKDRHPLTGALLQSENPNIKEQASRLINTWIDSVQENLKWVAQYASAPTKTNSVWNFLMSYWPF